MAEAKTTAKHNTLAEALIAFQKNLPAVTLDGDNPHFKSKYATLANVTNILLPKLAENGIAFVTGSRVEGGLLILEAKLLHESGEFESASFPITETNPQKVGSAVTYYRRYALASLTGVVADGDDDGNTASIPSAAERQVAKAKPVATPSKGSAMDEIRTGWITTGKLTKERANEAIMAYEGQGKNRAQAAEAVLNDLKSGNLA